MINLFVSFSTLKEVGFSSTRGNPTFNIPTQPKSLNYVFCIEYLNFIKILKNKDI